MEWISAIRKSVEYIEEHGEKTDPDYHSAVWLPVKRK